MIKIIKGFILSFLTILLLSQEVYSQFVNIEDTFKKQIATQFDREDVGNYIKLLQSNEFDSERFKLNKTNDENSILIKEIKTTDLNGATYTLTYNYSSEGIQISRMVEWVSLDGAMSITIDKSIFDDEGNVVGFISESLLIISGYEIKSRSTYNYVEGGMNSFYEFWDGEKWIPNSRGLVAIDDIGRVVYTYEKWDGTIWEEDYSQATRETKTYNSEGNILQRLTEEHNGANWVNNRRYNTSYNSENNSSLYYSEKWEGGMWQINSGRITRVYDSNNINISKSTETWDGTIWNNYIKESYTRTAENKILLNLQERWDNNNWVNQIKKTYTYNNDGYQLTYLKEFWKEDIWENTERETNSYNSGAFEVSFLSETWSENNWENVNRSFSTFNHAENKTIGNYEKWSAGNWSEYSGSIGFFELSGKLSSYGASTLEVKYTTLTDIRETGIIMSKYSLEQNYPNPFNPTTQITYQIPENGTVSLKIYNMLGQEVAELVNEVKTAGAYNVTFNASNLASGTYFYRLQSGEFIETKKLMLIK